MKKEKTNFKSKSIFTKIFKKIGTIRYIFFIYVLFTVVMSLLLFWNISHNADEHEKKVTVKYLDALFIAASAFSDTGLTTVTVTDTFNIFGQALIAFCIFVGGVGIFTIKVYVFHSLLNLKSDVLSSQVSQTERGGKNAFETKQMIKVSITFIILATIISSIIFTLMFYFNPYGYFNDIKALEITGNRFNPYLAAKYNPYRNIFMSLRYGFFHSISSINNAGFDIIGDKSLQPYYKDYGLQIMTIIVFMIGGIGFPVIYDIWLKIKSTNKKNKVHRFSLFTKFTLVTYFATTAIALALTYAFELTSSNPNTIWNQVEYGNTWDKIFAIYFQTKSTRSAGFSTVNYTNFTQPTVVLHGILMFIGFSPVSTAGGIRNTTIAVIFLSVMTMITGRQRINAFKRQIGKETLIKATNVLTIGMLLVTVFTLITFVNINNHIPNKSEFEYPMTYVLFEICSAFGNSGLSVGATKETGVVGKILLIIMMIIGQFGIPQTIKIWGKWRTVPERYQFIYEDVSIG
ncbi:TrkH family potassium uptake protein [Mycoplasma struthionis]|uniref:TrkH family potassium uptake protein n=1 Tax=Mycoplasma struthionis TaxID=538220 RepID=A0A502M676_9MOLU|nr:potassium transporter TrkG [Mycoplasma struthionis]TPI01931.1 TrkH family potassium uptake protein [Mycoplasma struthionis]